MGKIIKKSNGDDKLLKRAKLSRRYMDRYNLPDPEVLPINKFQVLEYRYETDQDDKALYKTTFYNDGFFWYYKRSERIYDAGGLYPRPSDTPT